MTEKLHLWHCHKLLKKYLVMGREDNFHLGQIKTVKLHYYYIIIIIIIKS